MSFTSWSVSQCVSIVAGGQPQINITLFLNLSMYDLNHNNLLDLEVNTRDGNQKSTAISKQQYGLYH
ncbi:hypothetical protein T10_11806 [Trichinella papuae]|uniref:Uncharacterized protein n=1 Tax=Trichinella papuae TaxID=268474 RepID=A0A0V1MG00_9BILA|nr:hypothetical protein T10_2268 [Trichinella papuae]KRZ70756.1 hypothetical protein T10_2784 [Trichinella papuae]KRZ70758.1 hypothetical protein T10_11806 [Trichinella papuae]